MKWRKEQVKEPTLKEIKEIIEEPRPSKIIPKQFTGEEEVDESIEDLENQQRELQERLKKLESKKQEEQEAPGISKQEVIDMIQGSLNRIAQLTEILRRS